MVRIHSPRPILSHSSCCNPRDLGTRNATARHLSADLNPWFSASQCNCWTANGRKLCAVKPPENANRRRLYPGVGDAIAVILSLGLRLAR